LGWCGWFGLVGWVVVFGLVRLGAQHFLDGVA